MWDKDQIGAPHTQRELDELPQTERSPIRTASYTVIMDTPKGRRSFNVLAQDKREAVFKAERVAVRTTGMSHRQAERAEKTVRENKPAEIVKQ